MADGRETDLQVLGLIGEPSDEEILRACRRRVALYHRDSLATYSLLSDEERRETLARIERACHNLLGTPPAPESEARAGEAGSEVELPPDPAASPGAYLRHQRLARGLELAQVTARTKIRTAVIEDLEAERFDRLPARVYVRGFIIQLGRLFGVADPEALSASYLGKLSSARPEA